MLVTGPQREAGACLPVPASPQGAPGSQGCIPITSMASGYRLKNESCTHHPHHPRQTLTSGLLSCHSTNSHLTRRHRGQAAAEGPFQSKQTQTGPPGTAWARLSLNTSLGQPLDRSELNSLCF